MTDPTSGSMTGLFGNTVPLTIDGLRHVWTADASGLYQTTTDLAAEWAAAAKAASSGAALLPYQHAEADAAAIFANTGLAKLDPATQARDRADVQREIDAIDGARQIDAKLYGISPTALFTEQSYLQLGHTLQSTPSLEELAVQGHGLNAPPSAKYDGYTNDFQNNVDKRTLFVGRGYDHNENALAALTDDVVMTHLPFAVVVENGHVVQLNQNADRESGIAKAVGEANFGMFGRVFTAADFSTKPVHLPHATKPHATPPVGTPPTPLPANESIFGAQLPSTIASTAHTWTADATGLYHTSTDLKAEWTAIYAQMLAGKGAALTAEQRMEGNAEAVFENTGLNKLNATTQMRDREDLQREFDAIGAAMAIDATTLGISPTAKFTATSYVAMEQTIADNAVLQELGLQGHGLNHPPAARYAGYTNDIQNVVDNRTRFVGGGVDNGERAIPAFLDDVVLTHAPFPTVMRNGHAEQLNQNGAPEDRLRTAVAAINETAFTRTFTSKDFKAA